MVGADFDLQLHRCGMKLVLGGGNQHSAPVPVKNGLSGDIIYTTTNVMLLVWLSLRVFSKNLVQENFGKSENPKFQFSKFSEFQNFRFSDFHKFHNNYKLFGNLRKNQLFCEIDVKSQNFQLFRRRR